MKKSLFIYLMAIALIFSYGCNNKKASQDAEERAEDSNEAKLDKSMEEAAEFMVKAASGSMLEVQLGQMAQQKASSAEVKQFAQTMVDDHSQALDRIRSLAKNKNITLPSALSDEHQRHINDLSDKTGKDFDEKYMDMMVRDHREDVNVFKKAIDNLKDEQIKTLASETIPKLEAHLARAEELEKRVNKQ